MVAQKILLPYNFTTLDQKALAFATVLLAILRKWKSHSFMLTRPFPKLKPRAHRLWEN